MSIIKTKRVDVDEIKFSNPKPYSKGQGSSVSFWLNNKTINMQTPRLLSLYGLNIYKDEAENIKSINLVVQFNSDVDKSNRVNNFLNKIKKIDKLVASKANTEHKSWLHE